MAGLTTPAPNPPTQPARRPRRRSLIPELAGLLVVLGLVLAAMVVPPTLHWNVHVGLPPLFASWRPRVGAGTPFALALAISGVAYGERICRRLSWRRLLVAVQLASLAWLVSLLLVETGAGMASSPDVHNLLHAARHTTSIGETLHAFVDRIPATAPHRWTVGVAGHPAGALLFFVGLVRLGLDEPLVVNTFVALLASTIPLAVATTLRALGAEPAARTCLPFLVLAPAAVWEAVSFDAVLAFVAAWALAVLATGLVRRSLRWCLAAGLLFGVAVEMSYGLVLLGFLALGIAVSARCWRHLAWALIGAAAVVLAFTIAGFWIWDGYEALRSRYWRGLARVRPASYWLWGDLAALAFSAGPVLGACVGRCVAVVRRCQSSGSRDWPVPLVLGAAACLTVAVADASLMSKAEVERIWLPFVPWLLVMTALLPKTWRRAGLVIQVVAALAVQHLLVTPW